MRNDDQDSAAKKRLSPVGRQFGWPTGRRELCSGMIAGSALRSSISGGQGEATLEQLWTGEMGRALMFFSGTSLGITAGKTVFVPPRQWFQIHLPYKIQMDGGAAITTALQRRGLLAGLTMTRGGQLRVNI